MNILKSIIIWFCFIPASSGSLWLVGAGVCPYRRSVGMDRKKKTACLLRAFAKGRRNNYLLFELLFGHSYGFDKLGFQHFLFWEFCEVLHHMNA